MCNRVLITTIILGFLFAFATPEAPPIEKPKLNWTPIGKVESFAKNENKIAMIYVTSKGCAWCRKFYKNTLNNPEIIVKLNEKFRYAKVNISSHAKVEYQGKTIIEKKLGKILLVRSTPTTLFLDDDKKVIARIPGYMSVKDFSKVLTYLGDGWYEDISYEDFINSEEKLNKRN